jgi:hypothetical protein
MSDLDPSPAHLSDLSPEELDRRARAHIDGLFAEVRGMRQRVHEDLNPLKLAVKHPLVTAAVVGVAGFAVATFLQGRRRQASSDGASAGPPPIGRTLLSGLAGVAATALPELLTAYMQRRGGSAGPDEPQA